VFYHIQISGVYAKREVGQKQCYVLVWIFFITFDSSFLKYWKIKKPSIFDFLKIREPKNLTRINFSNVKVPYEISDHLTKKLIGIFNDFLVTISHICDIC